VCGFFFSGYCTSNTFLFYSFSVGQVGAGLPEAKPELFLGSQCKKTLDMVQVQMLENVFFFFF